METTGQCFLVAAKRVIFCRKACRFESCSDHQITDMSLELLSHLGFIHSGICSLTENQTLQIEIIANHQSSALLYAFVAEDLVKYIGVTTRTFENRMRGYAKPGRGQRTNIRVNAKIIQLLIQGTVVDIYTFSNKGLLQYQGLEINLAAGLEESLIRRIAEVLHNNQEEYLWNIDHNPYREITVIDVAAAIADEHVADALTYEAVPDVHLHQPHPFPTTLELTAKYMRAPFINIKREGAMILGANRESVLVQLGAEGLVLEAVIGRTTNSNGSPRIYLGKKYLEWLQANHREGDNLQIQILGPYGIKLI